MLRVFRNEAGERKPPPLRAKEKEGTIGHIYPRVTKVLGLGALLLVLTAGIAAAALPPNATECSAPVCTGTALTDWIVGPDPDDTSKPQEGQTFNGLDKLDQLEGKRGNDTLNGDGGSDWLYGGFDDDTVNGGAGNDHLIDRAGKYPLGSGPDIDHLYGGAGDDEFYIADGDGDDYVNCGGGTDKVVEKDPEDTIAANCEQKTTVRNAVAKEE